MTVPILEREKFAKRLLMWAKILAFFGLSGCALPGGKGDQGSSGNPRRSKELAVLFIGNSYSFDVPSEFKKIAKSNGKRVRVGHSTYGGWSLAQHSEYEPTLKKLRNGNWDVVVLQDHSLNPGKEEPERRKVMDPAVQFLATEAREIGATPVLYQTWGRRDGEPGKENDDFYRMNERVRRGYAAASERGGGIAIAPAGDAWEKIFDEGRGSELYVEDGSHPSAYGNKVTAKTIFETLFKSSENASG